MQETKFIGGTTILNKDIPHNKLRNLENLPRGMNCRWLICILSPDNTALIASKWCRKEPDKKGFGAATVLVDLGPRPPRKKMVN